MTAAKGRLALPTAAGDERCAYHEAARAVAMWRLGYRLGCLTIDPDEQTPGVITALTYDPDARGAAWNRRDVERNAMVLHAASVAELFLPGSTETGASSDHDHLHRELCAIEADEAVQITWCDYLWQRTRSVLAPPWQWMLIVALARVLRTCRTLSGTSAEFFIKHVGRVIDEHCMANMEVSDEVAHVGSPWHRTWHSALVNRTPSVRSTELPEVVLERMDVKEIRPLRSVLGPLSVRAQRILDESNIRTPLDLSTWSESELSRLRGAGKITVREIVEAAARAGVRIRSNA